MFALFKGKAARIPNAAGAMAPSTSTFMQERGWTKTSRGWAGPFSTRYGQWPGIVELVGDHVKAYIRYLPAELRQHTQGIGFHEKASGWFHIELAVNTADRDPNAVIRSVERMIVNAGDTISRTRQELEVAA